MDKQLLDALSDIGKGLDLLVEALNKKEKSNNVTSNTLQSGNFGEQLTEISVSLKGIEKSTQEILKKQDTILEMQKKKSSDKKNAVEETGDDPKKESSLKKGVTTILLIAVAVLAIGLAFKIIGKIDFLSVVGLGLAIVLISKAFQEVAKAKISVDDAIVAGKVMVIMSIAIAISSFVLSFVVPIGFTQALTAILIAAVFTVVSYGIAKLVGAFKKISAVDAIKVSLYMPIVLLAVSMAIAASSWVLSMVKPIGFAQAITAILIAGMFTVVSYGLAKLIGAFKKINAADALKVSLYMPIVLLAVSIAIAASSWVLGMIVPISFGQAITAILIAAMFTVISYGMAKLIGALKGIDAGTAAKVALLMPILLVAMSAAIAASSFFLSKVVPMKSFGQFITIIGIAIVFVVLAFALKIMAPAIDKIGFKQVITLPLIFAALSLAILISSEILSKVEVIPTPKLISILLFSIVFSVSAVLLGLAAYALSKIGIDQIIEGGISIIILATVVMVSSIILSKGEYKESGYPSWKWALGVTTAIVGFGLAATLLGAIVMSGGGLFMLAGAGAILGIAVVIVATSKILAMGDYTKYPGFGWAMGVGLSLTAFGTAMGLLGVFILGSLGLGMAALVAGGEAILMIADTIVEVSFRLKKGSYTGGPTIAWAGGIALALGAFAPIYAMLAANKIMSLFGGGVGPEDFANAIRTVSQGIVDAANYFAGAKVAFKGGPSKEWAEGVGTAISAFSPVYAALMDSGFFGASVTPEDMKSGILTISDGIIAAAEKFSKNIAVFDITKVPSKTWGENVGAALQAFAPVFAYMKENSGWFTSGEEAVGQMVFAVKAITNAIITVAVRFSKVGADVWKSYPPKTWIDSISVAVKGFNKLVMDISGTSLADTFTFNIVTSSLISTAKKLSYARNYFKTSPPEDWIKNIRTSIVGYIMLSDISQVAKILNLAKLNLVALSMVGVAKTMASGDKYFKKKIDPNYMKNLSKNVIDYLKLTGSISSMGLFSGIKSAFGMDPITQAANGMIKIAGAYDKLATALKKFGGALSSIDGNKVNLIRRLTGNLAVLSAMNSNSFSQMMKTLETKSSVFSKMLDVDMERGGGKRPSVGDKNPNNKITETKKPGKNDIHKQMEDVIALLAQISAATTTTAEKEPEEAKKSDGFSLF